MEHAYLGIDPGKTGGIVVIDSTRNILLHENVPYDNEKDFFDVVEMLKLTQKYSTRYKLHGVIEKQMNVTFQGGIATTLIGYGIWIAIMHLSLMTWKEVNANQWTKIICPPEFSKLSYGERKKQNALLAQRLFPEWKPKNVTEIKSQADAFLLADYCRLACSPSTTTITYTDKKAKISRTKKTKENFFLMD